MILSGEVGRLDRHDALAMIHKLLSNPTRLRILSMLQEKSLSFSELLRELKVNPKVLNDNLNTLSSYELIVKSYQHDVYVLTPLGRLAAEEGLLEMRAFLDQFLQVLQKREDLWIRHRPRYLSKS